MCYPNFIKCSYITSVVKIVFHEKISKFQIHKLCFTSAKVIKIV